MKKRLLLAVVVLTGMFLLSASIVCARPAHVAKTGQTTSYRTGDDGDYQLGVASPSPRFRDNGDGTVRDGLTGLMWAKDANMAGAMKWYAAIDYANDLSLGEGKGGKPRTDWRLPNRNELLSLVDVSKYNPAIPSSGEYYFKNVEVEDDSYWTSTQAVANHICGPDFCYAWVVNMYNGDVDEDITSTTQGDTNYVWPVRGGN
jgi:hypothetical protein